MNFPARSGRGFFIFHKGGGASLAITKMGETGLIFGKETRFLNPGTPTKGGVRERQTY